MITCCVCLLEPGEGFIKGHSTLSPTNCSNDFEANFRLVSTKKRISLQCGASHFTVARLPHAKAKALNSPIVILFAVDEAVSRVAAQLGVEILRASTAAEAGDVPGLVGGEEVVTVIVDEQLMRLMRQQLCVQ